MKEIISQINVPAAGVLARVERPIPPTKPTGPTSTPRPHPPGRQ